METRLDAVGEEEKEEGEVDELDRENDEVRYRHKAQKWSGENAAKWEDEADHYKY